MTPIDAYVFAVIVGATALAAVAGFYCSPGSALMRFVAAAVMVGCSLFVIGMFLHDVAGLGS